MKTAIIIISLAWILILTIGLVWFFGLRIDKEVRVMSNDTLCKSGTCLVTYVWNNGEIVYVSYRDPLAPSDSLRSDSIKAELFYKSISKF